VLQCPPFTANCVSWHFSEGQEIQGPAVVATLQGPAPVLLRGERVALNVLARCSSIATYARYVQTLTPCRIAGTRKTTPGFRLVEKYGLAVGGVDIHRTAVSGGCIMIKDNHVELCGGDIKMALERIRTFKSFTAKIEVECHDMQQASTAASNGADIVMLDNFIPSIDQLHSLKNAHPNLEIELSGGITPQTIHQYPQDPNIILSLGALTHSAPHLDFSFKIRAIDQ
jgi:nicotinate-nucleotide pyrophosphorylase (carboxylating)